jgi:hypothetical protein
MGSLRDEFAMQLHASLAQLEISPDRDAFDALARLFNVVGLAIEHDTKRSHDSRLINGGASALNQAERAICAGVVPRVEIPAIRVAVNTIDRMMGKLSINDLYEAMCRLDAMEGRL